MIRKLSFVATALLVLAGCAPQAAAPSAPGSAGQDPQWQKIVEDGKKEGQVLIYGRLLAGKEGSEVADEFNKRFGISVDFVDMSGSPAFERVRNEIKAGVPTADIYEGAPPWPNVFLNNDLIAPLKDKPLSELKDSSVQWQLHPGAIVPDTWSYLASRFTDTNGHYSVNPNQLPQADWPKSFHEMATNPKLKGKIAWANEKTGADVNQRFMLHSYVGGHMSLRDLWDLYRSQETLLFANPVDGVAAVGKGEAAVAVDPPTQNNLNLIQAGALKPVRFPEIPLVRQPQGMMLLKAAPHPNAALVFINWFFSKEGQDTYCKINLCTSFRSDVQDYQPEALKPIIPGGGKAGPTYVLNADQLQLSADLRETQVTLKITEPSMTFEEFDKAMTATLADWASKHGGPHKELVPLKER
jgi:iron(III) transport system substrate-binding protein